MRCIVLADSASWAYFIVSFPSTFHIDTGGRDVRHVFGPELSVSLIAIFQNVIQSIRVAWPCSICISLHQCFWICGVHTDSYISFLIFQVIVAPRNNDLGLFGLVLVHKGLDQVHSLGNDPGQVLIVQVGSWRVRPC